MERIVYHDHMGDIGQPEGNSVTTKAPEQAAPISYADSQPLSETLPATVNGALPLRKGYQPGEEPSHLLTPEQRANMAATQAADNAAMAEHKSKLWRIGDRVASSRFGNNNTKEPIH